MTDFTLDTSGTIAIPVSENDGYARLYRWSDLTPFAQGYVEALFASAHDLDLKWAAMPAKNEAHSRFIGFSDLSPEALALILRDCEAMAAVYNPTLQAGATFWSTRQSRGFRTSATRERFPPLTAYLSDDGKVCLREAAQ